ncbi:MAG TPA: sigma factor, partial [Verrucomicrobiae bacterium]|nr:sigma factor [Verrucomicrobiae bacterium]
MEASASLGWPEKLAEPKKDADTSMSPLDKPSPTAEELAVRSQAGCLESFEQLVRTYESRVFNFLRRLTGNEHDAEDLTQETFLKAFRGLPSY